MNLRQLKIVEAVSRNFNLTAAAEVLHMSQPAASLQLRHLEEEFGFKFFERNNHGMELTEQGREFLDAIRPVLQSIERIEAKFKRRYHGRFAQ